MATTLKDIASALGLSQVAVSNALRGTGRMSDETRERVVRVARELKYRPNGYAKTMREGRTGVIGLIYSCEGTSRALTDNQLEAIQAELSVHSYELMLGMVPKAQLASRGKASALLRHWMADGLLINHQIGLPQQIQELVEGDHVPAVWMNSRQSQHCVYFDDFGGAVNAVNHLADLGHRRIAYLDLSHPTSMLGGNEHYSIEDRYNGYLDAMKQRNLKPVVWMADAPVGKFDRVQRVVDWYNAASEKPTAIVTYGQGQEIMFAACRLGLYVPRDLSFITFSGERWAMNDMQVTSAFLQHNLLGQLAVQKLLTRLTDPSARGQAEAIPVLISEGHTTAPPRSQSAE